jgi:putative endonuclease
MGARCYYVYILASKIGGTLYIGVTNDLIRRVAEHKLKIVESFTKDYDVVRLVYFEQFDDPENAIKREKRLKKWKRDWKIALIEKRQSGLERSVSGDRGSPITSASGILGRPVKPGDDSSLGMTRIC